MRLGMLFDPQLNLVNASDEQLTRPNIHRIENEA